MKVSTWSRGIVYNTDLNKRASHSNKETRDGGRLVSSSMVAGVLLVATSINLNAVTTFLVVAVVVAVAAVVVVVQRMVPQVTSFLEAECSRTSAGAVLLEAWVHCL